MLRINTKTETHNHKIEIKAVMWDLFSDTSSVGKVLKMDWTVRSFEKDPKLAKKYKSMCTDVPQYDFIHLAKKEFATFK